MKKVFAAICFVLVVLFVSCSTKSEVTEVTDISKLDAVQKYYYAMGNYVVSSYSNYYPDMDAAYFAKGAEDFTKGFTITDEQINEIFTEYNAAQGAGNLEYAEKFLKENKSKDGVVSLNDKLQYKLVTAGNGESAANAKTVTVDYELTNTEGAVMDSSIQRGTPAQFGLDGVISGFADGIRAMNVGDTITLWIHPDLGYGANGTGSIKPNELLTFTVSLISIDN